MSSLADLKPNAPPERRARRQGDATAGAWVEPGRDRRGPLRPSRLTPTRLRLSGRVLTRFFQGGDALALAGGGFLAASLTHGANVFLIYGSAAVVTFASLRLFDCYKFGRREDLPTHLMRVTVCFAVAVAMCFALLTHFVGVLMLAAALGVWTPMAFLTVAAAHGVWWLNVKRWRANGRLTPNLVIVGATGAAERLISAILETREANVLGVFDDRIAEAPPELHGVPLLGGTDELLAHRIMPFVDRIVLTVPTGARERIHNLLERLAVASAASCFIERNFHTTISSWLKPWRRWRKKIGPGLSSFTAIATSSMMGAATNRAIEPTTMSCRRLVIALP